MNKIIYLLYLCIGLMLFLEVATTVSELSRYIDPYGSVYAILMALPVAVVSAFSILTGSMGIVRAYPNAHFLIRMSLRFLSGLLVCSSASVFIFFSASSFYREVSQTTSGNMPATVIAALSETDMQAQISVAISAAIISLIVLGTILASGDLPKIFEQNVAKGSHCTLRNSFVQALSLFNSANFLAIFLIAIEMLLIVASAFVSGRWYFDETGIYEPTLAVLASLIILVELVRSILPRGPR